VVKERHSGFRCCSKYCFKIESGAPPHETKQYERHQNTGFQYTFAPKNTPNSLELVVLRVFTNVDRSKLGGSAIRK
jgi:hypothetical protein